MKPIPLWGKLLGGIAVLGAIGVGLSLVPTGDVAYEPIAPIDLEGKIRVKGQVVEPLQGRMYLVGVTEKKVNLLERLVLDVTDPSVDFGPAPAQRTGDGTPRPRDVESMAQAKSVAAGVALELAGQRVDWEGTAATVDRLHAGTPAAQQLRRGDLITEVNGAPVDTSVEVTRIVNRLAPGTRVSFGISRAGEIRRVQMTTIAPVNGDHSRRSRLGMELSTIGLQVNLPFDVSIDSGDVVGPSAGLAFTLYLYDSLSRDDLMQGRHVVATGAVSPDGAVLPVGRIRQKVVAVQRSNRDVLVVPFGNADAASQAAKEACGEETQCVQVVPVRSVQEAIELLGLSADELQGRVAGSGEGQAAAA